MPVPDAAVVPTARTAIGTAFKGTLTLIHELRRRGGGTGVAAMCAGGGMSTAVVLDVPEP